jgi:hypothetical protein
MNIESVAVLMPREPYNGSARTVMVLPTTAPPRTGGTQMKPSQRIARMVSAVDDIATMSPSVASISRSSAGRMATAARMFCSSSMCCVCAW